LAHRAQIAEKRHQVQACRTAPDTAFLARCQRHLDFAQLAGPRMARAAQVIFAPLFRGAGGMLRLATGR